MKDIVARQMINKLKSLKRILSVKNISSLIKFI